MHNTNLSCIQSVLYSSIKIQPIWVCLLLGVSRVGARCVRMNLAVKLLGRLNMCAMGIALHTIKPCCDWWPLKCQHMGNLTNPNSRFGSADLLCMDFLIWKFVCLFYKFERKRWKPFRMDWNPWKCLKPLGATDSEHQAMHETAYQSMYLLSCKMLKARCMWGPAGTQTAFIVLINLFLVDWGGVGSTSGVACGAIVEICQTCFFLSFQ